MFEEDVRQCYALGPGGADIVLMNFVEDYRAIEPHRSAKAGQDRYDDGYVDIRRRVVSPGCGRVYLEHQPLTYYHVGQERHAHADDRDQHAEVVYPCAAEIRDHAADDHRGQPTQRESGDRDSQREPRLGYDDIEQGFLRAKAFALKAHAVPHVIPKLRLGDFRQARRLGVVELWQVQFVSGLESLLLLRPSFGVYILRGDIPSHDVEQQKSQHHYAEDSEHRLHQSADNIRVHYLPPSFFRNAVSIRRYLPNP